MLCFPALGCSTSRVFECGEIMCGELELHLKECSEFMFSDFEFMAAAGAVFSKTTNSFAMISNAWLQREQCCRAGKGFSVI